MARLLAYLLIVAVLFQTLGPELLVVNYAVNQARITQRYCVNKARPALRCNGKCYLAKQLRRAAERESKAPATGLAKIKFEVVLPMQLRLLAAASAGPVVPLCYARVAVPSVSPAPLAGVFHPPAVRG